MAGKKAMEGKEKMGILLGIQRFTQKFFGEISRTILPRIFDLEIVGQKNFENIKGPLVVTINHTSWFDLFFTIAVVPPRSRLLPIRFPAWYKHFWKLCFIFAPSGGFPVRRGVGIEKTLEPALKVLKSGGVVGIAPEGKRRHRGRPKKARRGAAFLALSANCPVLPICIDGSVGLSFSDLWKRKRKIRIIIGKPFNLTKKKITKPEDLNKPSNLIMQKIRSLRIRS